AKLAGAQRVRRLDDLVWAVTAACDAGDDTQQRQCKRIRDTRATELANATLLIDAEPSAFTLSPWNAQKKSSAITLSACVRCTGIEVEGATWLIGGATKDNRLRVVRDKLITGQLVDTARTFPTADAAKAFAQQVGTARVELIA